LFQTRIIAQLFSIGLFFAAMFEGGVIAALLRIKAVEAPILYSQSQYQSIIGEIVNIDKSIKGKSRIKIKIYYIDEVSKNNLPKYARLNIENISFQDLGKIIKCKGFLAPPPSPILPNSYNFALKSYFLQIGAIGRCDNYEFLQSKTNQSNILKEQNTSIAQLISNLRLSVSDKIAHGEIGGGRGFLAAILTGDRSYISPNEAKNLQISGLGHIVSVSGLHVGLLGGIVFLILNKLFALSQTIALVFDVKKLAALLSFIIVAFYTFFTGAEAPALRAMIMVFVACLAIFLDRREINMRGLAFAAMILLVWHPENAVDAGFLMSFLATMALISLWENFSDKIPRRGNNFFETILFWCLGALLTSLIAGIATIPISLLSFKTLNTYGLIANLLAAPFVDFVVAPFALFGAIFAFVPFFGTYISNLLFNISAWGLQKVLDIALFFANFDNSSFAINGFEAFSAILVCLGIFIICIFRSRIKLIGIVPIIIAILPLGFAPKLIAAFADSANAMYYFEKIGQEKICFEKGGKFAASRLLDANNKNPKNTNIEHIISSSWAQNCAIGGGDWEAHFINKDKDTKVSLKNFGKGENIISLNITGKNHILTQNSAPNGALLVRKDHKLFLRTDFVKAPWNKAYLVQSNSFNELNKNSNNDDIMPQEHLVP
jgi:competence protein ComEC